MNIFAKRFAELRQEKKITRKQLSEKLNVSVRLIAYWEKGQRECDFDMLLNLSKIFDVSIDYLLGNKDY